MTRRLIVRPRALRELYEAVDWYESQRRGLGSDFFTEFRRSVAAIGENPFQYQLFGRNARRSRVQGFPYGLIYTVSEDEIVIVACFHSSRNPAPWRD